jgi:hypothetical protein
MKSRIIVFAAAVAFIILLGLVGRGLLRDYVIVDKNCATQVTSVKHEAPVTITTKAEVCRIKVHDTINPTTPDAWVKVTPTEYDQATVGTHYQGEQ